VSWGDEHSFVVADIPGLIEGAHEGKGLGVQFLRHIERTAFLLHLVDISEWAAEDPVTGFDVMRKELVAYEPSLKTRPFAVVGTKLDIKGTGERLEQLRAYCKRRRIKFFSISAVTREGLDTLVTFVGEQVETLRAPCETAS
jgi:GTP-binding protein